MAKARKSGQSIEESIKAAVDYGIDQDFEKFFKDIIILYIIIQNKRYIKVIH